jgi:superfamily II DNA helicase RecQ
VVIRTDPGLVFTGTRQNVVRYLNIFSQVRPFLPYHAGMSDEERRSVENVLQIESKSNSLEKKSIVATNAFGMGMDFPQFSWTVISQIPFSLLGLMQAFGRVGRSGKRGEARLYWAEEDFRFAGLLLGPSQAAESRGLDALALLREYVESNEETRREIESKVFL